MNESPLLTVHILKIYIYLNYQVDREIMHNKICVSNNWDKTIIQKLTLKSLNVHWKIFKSSTSLSLLTSEKYIPERSKNY